MKLALPAACALAACALVACSKSDTQPRPAGSDVAASMPTAGSTPGAQGPATAAPHETPPATNTLSDTHPQPAPPAGPAGNTTQ
jgi:hypothetical protein